MTNTRKTRSCPPDMLATVCSACSSVVVTSVAAGTAPPARRAPTRRRRGRRARRLSRRWSTRRPSMTGSAPARRRSTARAWRALSDGGAAHGAVGVVGVVRRGRSPSASRRPPGPRSSRARPRSCVGSVVRRPTGASATVSPRPTPSRSATSAGSATSSPAAGQAPSVTSSGVSRGSDARADHALEDGLPAVVELRVERLLRVGGGDALDAPGGLDVGRRSGDWSSSNTTRSESARSPRPGRTWCR